MAKIKEEYSCALLLAMDLVGGKWKLRILWHIVHGDNRYSLLQKGIPDITEKMLTTQLREMEISGLIHRTVVCEKPLHVEYSLNDAYKELKVIVDSLCDLGKAYGKSNSIVVNE
ncbi:winged helix-turn-helix transcriptional regulator [Acidaminobacter sp. JC074]|uniref:winged helix-turn-helix transcriptional regulator n=1 Tax=Acidaminobacter sp. JC074 TaxID=2530199 RepID=UPI001F117A09|nr:winged helix-turn-helix transcriptional regulator [Acidaminobacter sp. JC074]MCH4888357.1 winged helix-turn-helix transcriptional regulator [Acidaminobacter sp. JC074]